MCGGREETQTLVANPEGKRSLEKRGVTGRIILKWILKSGMGGLGLD
jgi:hypothetical protein